MGLLVYNEKLSRIIREEKRISLSIANPIEEATHMIDFISLILSEVKSEIVSTGFKSETSEIQFFKNVKPQILGKLFYYNKIYNLEIMSPVDEGIMYFNYFSKELKKLKTEYKRHLRSSNGFYQYYRSSRVDLDHLYFLRGNIDFEVGLSSFVFEMDPMLTTYYDYKVAKIISAELVNIYLHSKIESVTAVNVFKKKFKGDDIRWTASKNALIELIYALHISGHISHGKVGIKKMALFFQSAFGVQLGDIHHAFHRMKDRSGSQTLFIDQLKISRYFHVSIDLLISLDLQRIPLRQIMELPDNRIILPVAVDNEGRGEIEIIPHKASMGYLSG